MSSEPWAKQLRFKYDLAPGFELTTSRSWQYTSCHWDACSNHSAISDFFKRNVLPHYLRGLKWCQMHGLSDRVRAEVQRTPSSTRLEFELMPKLGLDQSASSSKIHSIVSFYNRYYRRNTDMIMSSLLSQVIGYPINGLLVFLLPTTIWTGSNVYFLVSIQSSVQKISFFISFICYQHIYLLAFYVSSDHYSTPLTVPILVFVT